MKALSFRQPWGWAITDVAPPEIAKRLENRIWRHLRSGHPPIGLQEDFAIHVSATKPYEFDIDGVLDGMGAPDPFQPPPAFDLRSAIIGIAQIAMVLRCKEEQRNLPKHQFDRITAWEIDPIDRDKFLFDLSLPLTGAQRHDQIKRWWMGPFAFVLTHVRRLEEPVMNVKGALNFWQVPTELETQIRSRTWINC